LTDDLEKYGMKVPIKTLQNDTAKPKPSKHLIVRMKNYAQIGGGTKLQVSSVGEEILRRFDRTELPKTDEEIYCPHFMLLAWANGCPFNCSWCFLKGTFRFRGQHENGRVPQEFKSRERVGKHLEAFLAAKDLPAEIIDTGELSDSLMDEGKREEVPFSEWIMSYFLGSKHKVLFLTKSINIKEFILHGRAQDAKWRWQQNAILGWSVNAAKVSEKWEVYAPTMIQRLDAAKQVYDLGYEVRLRIDPMVPVENWKEAYGELVDEIYKRLKPSTITLGSLRGLSTTIIYAQDKSWVPYLTEKSNWGKKMPFKQRVEMYKFITDKIRHYDKTVNIGICKETLGLHKALGSDPAKMHCNCVW
jgi:spore photoproduct lyase